MRLDPIRRTLGGAGWSRALQKRKPVVTFYTRNRQHVPFFFAFVGVFVALWHAKRDVGFVINWVWFGLVWGFLLHLRRMERAKQNVGFGIRGSWWKLDPSPGPGP